MQIGLVGAGLMGHGLAVNLLQAGHKVIVVAHRNRAPIEDLTDRGAREASNLAALAGEAEVILLCLTDSLAVEEVVQSLQPHVAAGRTIVDVGTSEPESNRRLAAHLASDGIAFAEAPLTGGPEQAAAGELGALVGAEPHVFERIRPVLECFCAGVAHVGPVGAGQTAKLINNYLVLGMVAMIAETYNVARKAGVDWGQLYDAMVRGSGNSGALRKIVGPALHGDYDGYAFSLANANKDMSYYTAVAAQFGGRSGLSQAVMGVYEQAVFGGKGSLRVSRLIDPALNQD